MRYRMECIFYMLQLCMPGIKFDAYYIKPYIHVKVVQVQIFFRGSYQERLFF